MEYYTNFIPPVPLLVKERKILSDNNIYVFDTEVSSLFKINGEWQSFDYTLSPKDYRDVEKAGVVYIWGFSANDKTYYGRTLNDFYKLLYAMHDDQIKKVIYVHNLAYDFHFLLNIISDFEVFARKAYHPIKAYSPSLNIEFRCSYFLTNSNLDDVSKNYKLPIRKLKGDLDYRKARHSKTYIYPEEFKYLENDLLIVYHLIKQVMLPLYNTISKIPLTQTGRVRKEVKSLFTGNGQYFTKLRKLQPKDVDEFSRLRNAFAGGWTHSNVFHTNHIIKDVFSYDRASSYPSVMLMEKFPMTPFRPSILAIEMINFKTTACLIEVTFFNLQTIMCNTYLSFSKATRFNIVKTDNGRVMSADIITYVMTEVDFDIVRKCYTWDKMVVENLQTAVKSYLPQKFLDYICKLYSDKTKLKGISEMASVYARTKEYINSLYGMCVTNTIKDESMLIDNEWVTERLTIEQIEEKIIEQNKKSNFLSYAWGVWVTAYARAELWKIISEIDMDVVYCDTDSIKFVGSENIEAFDNYNKDYIEKLKNRGIDWDLLAPLDKNGVRHPIGIFEPERKADKFITLGAKKYCCQYGNELKITISGVPKKGVDQLSSIKDFKKGFIFDYSAGKLLSYYCHSQCSGGIVKFKDYNGLEGECGDNFGICLMPTTYSLGLSTTYEDLLTALSSQKSNKPTALDYSPLSEVYFTYFNEND